MELYGISGFGNKSMEALALKKRAESEFEMGDFEEAEGLHKDDIALVKDIVNDIWKKLDYDSSIILTKNLVGLESLIEEIENLLCIKGFCKLEIWGIGKATLAGAIFEKSQNRDEHHNHGFTFTKKRLISRKKVLIVFDNITKLEQIECLMGVFDNLDSESRIIITTRDKHVLTNCKVDHIHEMAGLSSYNALQLFALYAFIGNPPTEDYNELLSIVVAYAKGVPLAFKVLGSFLFKRKKREWESALKNLRTSLHMDVRKVLNISYDGLNDKEKVVFLHIACFFKEYKRDLIEAILNARDFNSHISMHLRIERCLIATSFNVITMHDLLEEMDREIVRQESIDNSSKRSRLWDHNEIISVLKYNMGIKAIRSKCLDMSKVEELHLNPKAFNSMQNLRFLKFYGSKHGKKVPESDSSALHHNLRCLEGKNSSDGKKLHGFKKLKFDFYEIRHFCFHGYPTKSLPPNFNPKNLVAPYMPNSKVKKLWIGNQILVNLKHIDLSHSKYLCKIPDFLLMPNLKSLNLEDCTNLLESFSSIYTLHKLVILKLQGCKSFDYLLFSDNCQSLREVNLSNCSNQETVSYLPNTIEKLYLDGIVIKEFPSIGHLFRLVKLSLRKYSGLERLPNSTHELKSLKCLYLLGCSKLDKLPNDMGNSFSLVVYLNQKGLRLRLCPVFYGFYGLNT
ncbi:disease resistance protein RPV1-like [Mangifera indica]|uniref:disease resistance protein RPV1-like n=1 Tax=Mangifera indica TaxID=29780 RepID=UPI001CFA3F7B|nr:disease resistance protein RPV1-like [Mangifera indica]